ncbi:MAG: di-trans,poly-cis-decaprenylcistransferase [Candidatus Micrarchaeota archaeon]|nr:di-trans,poly-cis-decaprenylcistransferase [Candidatus Micrarchaeota archaeon]
MVNPKRSSTRTLSNVPKHVALIPDGNRRWSNKNRLALFSGYQMGVKKFIDFSIWAKSFGVKTLTVWALSTENVKARSNLELNALYKLYVQAATDPKILADLKANNARIRVIGNMYLVPTKVKDALLSLEKKTKMYKEFTINLLIGYGGRDDLLYAVRDIRSERAKNRITESMVGEHIRTSSVPNVDLLIRTSGEQRLSGFLPWQTSYSELYFAKKYWPDFKKSDLRKALVEFSERQRRYGK